MNRFIRLCVAFSRKLAEDITAFRPTHSGDVKDADGRMRGFILRRRKREIVSRIQQAKIVSSYMTLHFFHIAPMHFAFSDVLNFLHTSPCR